MARDCFTLPARRTVGPLRVFSVSLRTREISDFRFLPCRRESHRDATPRRAETIGRPAAALPLSLPPTTALRRIKAAVAGSHHPVLDLPVGVTRDVLLDIDGICIGEPRRQFLDVPLAAIVALDHKHFAQEAGSWRTLLDGLHGTGWDDRTIAWIESEIGQSWFPAPEAAQDLRLYAVGGAVRCGNGMHRLVAAVCWLAAMHVSAKPAPPCLLKVNVKIREPHPEAAALISTAVAQGDTVHLSRCPVASAPSSGLSRESVSGTSRSTGRRWRRSPRQGACRTGTANGATRPTKRRSADAGSRSRRAWRAHSSGTVGYGSSSRRPITPIFRLAPMANRIQTVNQARTYTRSDFTALRAFVQRVPAAMIARLYFTEDNDGREPTPGWVESYLRRMQADLVALAIEHGSPVLADPPEGFHTRARQRTPHRCEPENGRAGGDPRRRAARSGARRWHVVPAAGGVRSGASAPAGHAALSRGYARTRQPSVVSLST